MSAIEKVNSASYAVETIVMHGSAIEIIVVDGEKITVADAWRRYSAACSAWDDSAGRTAADYWSAEMKRWSAIWESFRDDDESYIFGTRD